MPNIKVKFTQIDFKLDFRLRGNDKKTELFMSLVASRQSVVGSR